MIKTFCGGIHIKDYKWLTECLPIKKAPIPKKVRIPLNQHTGKPAQPIVKVGDIVRTGQLIAASQGFISGNIHSSITGKVTAIDRFPEPVSGEYTCIEIESDGRDEVEKLPEEPDITKKICLAGVVGMGGAMFPTHVKLQPPKDKPIDTVILNGAECEPYVTCDYRLMIERPKDVLEGLKIIIEAVSAKKGIIGIESNKPKAIKIFQGLTLKNSIEVVSLKAKYPQGGEKQLIKAVLNREVPSGGLPFDVGVVVQNIGTAVAIYEAVRLGKPLYERVVTVTGPCIKEPGNWLVRIGTMFGDLVEWSGGLKKDVGKLIMGGPMMGIAQWTFDVPVTKGTNAILLLGRDEVRELREETCIRCGRCIMNCPMGLNPTLLGTLVRKERFEEAKELGVMDCIECGICAYVCPSNRKLVQLIKYAKRKK